MVVASESVNTFLVWFHSFGRWIKHEDSSLIEDTGIENRARCYLVQCLPNRVNSQRLMTARVPTSSGFFLAWGLKKATAKSAHLQEPDSHPVELASSPIKPKLANLWFHCQCECRTTKIQSWTVGLNCNLRMNLDVHASLSVSQASLKQLLRRIWFMHQCLERCHYLSANMGYRNFSMP